MNFQGTPAFTERNYVIDFIRNKVDIETYKHFYYYIYDFSLDLGTKVVIWTAITMLITDTNLIYIISFYSVFFLIFNILYVLMNNKLLVNLQLFFELYPYLFFKRKKIIIINNHKRVIIRTKYLKYNLLFYGRCKKELSKIYCENKPLLGYLVIEFKKPTKGKIEYIYRGITKKNVIQTAY